MQIRQENISFVKLKGFELAILYRASATEEQKNIFWQDALKEETKERLREDLKKLLVRLSQHPAYSVFHDNLSMYFESIDFDKLIFKLIAYPNRLDVMKSLEEEGFKFGDGSYGFERVKIEIKVKDTKDTSGQDLSNYFEFELEELRKTLAYCLTEYLSKRPVQLSLFDNNRGFSMEVVETAPLKGSVMENYLEYKENQELSDENEDGEDAA
jgi:hypothetical protein